MVKDGEPNTPSASAASVIARSSCLVESDWAAMIVCSGSRSTAASARLRFSSVPIATSSVQCSRNTSHVNASDQPCADASVPTRAVSSVFGG